MSVGSYISHTLAQLAQPTPLAHGGMKNGA